MQTSFRLTKIALLFLAANLTASVYAADAGTIDKLSGNATITSANNQTRPATANSKIQSGDTITTEGKSEALVKMADNSVVALRQNTQFQFTDFKFEEKRTDSSISTLIRGTARLVSGLIGKANPENMKVAAKTATIGIRGTDFEVAVVEQDSAESRAGIYNYVHDGATNVLLAQGPTSDVRKEQTAFSPANPRPGESLLQIMDNRPSFLQAGGGFDALMQAVTNAPQNIIMQIPTFR